MSDERWQQLKQEARDLRFFNGILGNAATVPGVQGTAAEIAFNDDGIYSATYNGGPNDVVNHDEVFPEYDGVVVEAGARITTAPLGITTLIGHNVTNRGTITATQGQVLLAAGRSIALIDANNRTTGKISGYVPAIDRGGLVVNEGLIESRLGNVSLAGKHVTHSGVIAATTSAEQAGSVLISATNGIYQRSDASNLLYYASNIFGSGLHRGTVSLGEGSHISILPDTNDEPRTAPQFQRSFVEISGGKILFEDNSTLWAPGANASLQATIQIGGWDYNTEFGRLYLGKGAVLDVSGLNGIEIDMESNSVKAELRANELADNPVLRDSILRGETVWFDGRLGEKLTDGSGIADFTGWYDLIQRDGAQFMTVGGTINVNANEVIAREGSLIDLSGGSVVYNDGNVRRTKLIDQFGRITPIEFAQRGVNYVGLEGDFVVSHERWGVTETFRNPFARVTEGSWQRGYVEGRSAGALNIVSVGGAIQQSGNNQEGDVALIFEGAVRAGVIVGDYQSEAPAGAGVTDLTRIWRERPRQGTLLVGRSDNFGTWARINGGNITIGDLEPRLGADFTSASALFDFANNRVPLVAGLATHDHWLPTAWFDGANFGNVTFYSGVTGEMNYVASPDGYTLKPGGTASGGTLTIGKGVTMDLGDHGSLNFVGNRAEIDGTIRAAGGDVRLEAQFVPALDTNPGSTIWAGLPDIWRPGIRLGEGAVIDVAGRWSNNWLEALDGEALTRPVVDGGQVQLVGYDIRLLAGSLIDVGGGAHLATDGRTLTLGDGGSIVIDNSNAVVGISPAQTTPGDGALVLEGTLSALAPGRGGSLTIDTSDELIVADDWGDLAAIAGGVLEAGTAAPRDVVLAEALTLPAGILLTFDASNRVTGTLTGGQTLMASTIPILNNAANRVTLLQDWIVPEGVIVRTTTTSPGNAAQVVYGDGKTTLLPVGTTLRSFGTSSSNGTLPAGFTVPEGLFSYDDGTQGLKLADAAQVLIPAGTVLEAPIVLAAGFVLSKGSTLPEDVSVNNSFRLVTPDFFQGGAIAGAPDDWGDLAAIAGGVLEAGTAAPIRLKLTRPLVIAAGEPLPADTSFRSMLLPPDTPVAARSYLDYSEWVTPLTLAGEWTVPAGITVNSAQYVDGRWLYLQSYYGGATVPAGTRIGYISGNLDAGGSLPGSAFPDGLTVRSALTQAAVKGSTLDYAVSIPAGAFIDAGTVLGDDAAIAFASRLAGQDFEQAGFTSLSLSGARGLTVTSGTEIAPTVDVLHLTGRTREIATGARLADLAGIDGSGVSRVNSNDLLEAQRPAIDLTLASYNLVSTSNRVQAKPSTFEYNRSQYPGSVTVEAGASILLPAESRLKLDSLNSIFVDGTISAPGGEIAIGTTFHWGAQTAIRVGDNARLLAAGYNVTDWRDGLAVRSVADGGAIRIGTAGEQGDLPVLIGAGALLDVSGVAGIADLPDGTRALDLGRGGPLTPVAVDGAAGSITVGLGSGAIAGTMLLAPGGETGRGGTLDVAVFTQSGARLVQIDGELPEDFAQTNANSAIPASIRLFADRINGSGLEDLSVRQRGGNGSFGLQFGGDVTLEAPGTVNLRASYWSQAGEGGGNVRVKASHINMRAYRPGDLVSAVLDAAPTGSVTLEGALIDIEGVQFQSAAGLGGFADVRLLADGAIRPSLLAPGTLLLSAAQVYAPGRRYFNSPDYWQEEYDLADTATGHLVRAGQSIRVESNGNAAPVPYEVGQRLTLRAPEIDQAGVLRSPGGQLRLEAAERLTLHPGSITSTSLEGLTVLAYNPVHFVTGLFDGYGPTGAVPTSHVTLESDAVDVQAGAVIDLSGGGDIRSWQFRSGDGGTRNLLTDLRNQGGFAIMPAAANDTPTSITTGSNGTATAYSHWDEVWISGLPGVADGYYTVLPTEYALLDGAYLVRPLGGATAGPVATVQRDDGAHVVSGYFKNGGTSQAQDQSWSSFEVMDRASWGQYSNVVTFSFNETKAALAAAENITLRLLSDAGTLSVRAGSELALNGKALWASEGLSGNLDISGGKLALVGNGAVAPEGWLAVDARQVEALGAGSVLLGGERPRTSAGTASAVPGSITLATRATDVLVAEGTALTVPELLLAAGNNVSVGEGAVLTAEGSAKLDASNLLLSGDGALLRLSSGERVGLVRSGGSGAIGSLAVADDAVLKTSGVLLLDASAGFDLSRDALLDTALLDLASERINLGAVPEDATGTTIGLATLERLAASADLLLRGHQSINFYGDLALGARGADGQASLRNLTLDTTLLQGHLGAGETLAVTADVLTLRNSGNGGTTGTAGTGRLLLDVNTLALGPGAGAIGGFAAVNGSAGEIRMSGDGRLAMAGDIDLAAGRVVAGKASDYTLAATGDLSLSQSGAEAGNGDAQLGGRLSIQAANLAIDTRVEAKAGTILLEALSGDLSLGSGAVLDATGATVDFRDVAKHAPGGLVRLTAAGDVLADAESLIDVSGDARGGAAGVVEVVGSGSAALAGTLRAESAEGHAGGGFELDAGTTDFAGLNTLLNAGRFTALRDIRLDQAITLAAGDAIDAHRVSLVSRSGDVTIAGTIAAKGDAVTADGGQVSLSGRNVTLLGRIDAAAASVDAEAFQPAAGRVVLAADEGRVVLASGSAIDLTGGREGGGRLVVRADRTATGANADLSGTVTGARDKLLVGSEIYSAATVDAALASTVIGDANLWLAGASAPAGWSKGAGIVIRAGGDLRVVDDIDLAGIAGPGYLGLEAGGNLIIDATISDGFASASADAALDSGASFDYGFAAGGDIRLGELIERTPPSLLTPGEPLPAAQALADIMPITVSSDWVVPSGIGYLMTSDYWYYYPGGTVPAGKTIIAGSGSLLAGLPLPAALFPNGLVVEGVLPPFTGTGRIVRTGTGDIDVRAGQNLRLGNESTIYTAGRATATDAAFDRTGYGSAKDAATRVLGEFPTQGGNVSLAAGGDILAPTVGQSASAWLFRYGQSWWDGNADNLRTTEQTNWSVVYRNFGYAVGALGGGNVDVRADGNIVDLSVALPTTGHQTTVVGEKPVASDLIVRGGGDLSVRSGSDIRGGSFLIGKGQATLVAAHDIAQGQAVEGGVVTGAVNGAAPVVTKRGLYPLFGLMDATVSVIGAADVGVEGGYDPMLSPQICENLLGACTTGATLTGGTGTTFFGYSPRAGITALAAGGGIVFAANGYAGTSLSRLNRAAALRIIPQATSFRQGILRYENYGQVAPGTLRFASLQGDVTVKPAWIGIGVARTVGSGSILETAPSPFGTIEWLAAKNVTIDTKVGTSQNMYAVSQMDIGADYVRNALAPMLTYAANEVLSGNSQASLANNYYRGFDLLHAMDAEPLRIVALTGNIGIGAELNTNGVRLISAKPIDLYAAQDIRNINADIMHLDAGNLSRVIAGRDIYNTGSFQVAGQGLLWIEAGRDYLTPMAYQGDVVSLGSGNSRSSGSDNNPALPDIGADISIVTGTAQGVNAEAFAALYLDPAKRADPAFGLSHPTNQGKVVQTYEEDVLRRDSAGNVVLDANGDPVVAVQGLTSFLRDLGLEATEENRLELFAALPRERRLAFLNGILLTELQQTGVDYNNPDGSRFQQYTRGYSALHLLYSGTEGLERDNPLGGNITLRDNLIESRSGGSINMIAPYGRIALGDPAAINPSSDGVLSRRGGSLSFLANGTISLDLSRTFTMQGGDILMWTSNGDITAGSGAKTNVINLPPAYIIDTSGRMSVNVFGLQTGAGIGVLDAFEGRDPDRRPSRLDLLAFFGEVNAGDAGIRVVGDVNIAALRVVNAANIEVSGDAVGIPEVPAVNVGALSAASAATSAIVNEAAQLAERSRPQIRTEIPVILTVTFVGFGE
ncbi:filamentous hemagglutinin family protein [Sandaracinobacter sp. RS1-74]|uniref:filamentous haemagglutinin family protein n=1 Tax=Sandaracinobacteroides sayramensis TaxID=2913411 RepID=UPI001EDB0486|nr:filamentous haemagglutinin family protein [Sandaracinobacteroides sayramensis]MCG2839880.1 filamentous hemagglutinin family protein [Sandaracinobacteroides sayramensis]